jgi:hypothetical protein
MAELISSKDPREIGHFHTQAAYQWIFLSTFQPNYTPRYQTRKYFSADEP